MTKCVNCDNDARYVHKVTPNPRTDKYYCTKDLPRFLYPQMKAGLLDIPVVLEPVVEAPAPTPKKSKKEVVTPVETPAEPDADIVE